jgi:hypothetical protein
VVGGLALVSLFGWTGLPWYGVLALLAVVALFWDGRWPAAAECGLAVFLAGSAAMMWANGYLQLRAATWNVPEKTADFLLQHHIRGRIFNTYSQGGYLLWRLWPEQQVFVDGRALSESVVEDATRINMNATASGGKKSSEELLADYGVDVIVMDGFEPISGLAYYLPAALADPAQKEWKLVYQDAHDVIYMRHPPADVPVLNSLDALSTMERQCAFYIGHGAPACAQGMADIFTKIGNKSRAQEWLDQYRANSGKIYRTR